jgi:hypothetical protein
MYMEYISTQVFIYYLYSSPLNSSEDEYACYIWTWESTAATLELHDLYR